MKTENELLIWDSWQFSLLIILNNIFVQLCMVWYVLLIAKYIFS